jgi:ribonuclease P protein subunit RPR2
MKDDKLIKEVAADRMERLFSLAEKGIEAKTKDSETLAKRYVALARKISAHYKVKLTAEMKNRICKKCNSVLVPGISCTVRLASQGCMVYRCACGEQKKIFLKKLPHSKPV